MSRLRPSKSGPTTANGTAHELPPEVVNDPVALDAQNSLAKLAAQAKTPANPVDAIGNVGPKVMLQELTFERTAPSQNPASLMRAGETVRGGHAVRAMMVQGLAELANSNFSEQSQREFVNELSRSAKTKWQPGVQNQLEDEHMADLAWVASTIRKVIPHGDTKLDTMTQFFADHGMKLRSLDKVDSKMCFAQLDRGKFRKTLNDIAERGGKMTQRDMRTLLAQLSHVKDIDDMKWAQSRLRTREKYGRLEIPNHVRAQFEQFMGKHIDDNADVAEIQLAARSLRHALKNGDAVAVQANTADFEALIASAAANKNDPDAFFAARRVINRELGKCGDNAEAADTCRKLTATIDAKKGDKLDRYARNKKIESLVASGGLTRSQANVMRVGVATSVTNTEFVATMRMLDEQLKLQLGALILEAMEEMSEVFERNMRNSDDELDSNGNVIVSAEQKEQWRAEKRRQLKQLEKRSDEQRSAQKVAAFNASASSLEAAAASVPKTPSNGNEADSLRGRAGLEAHYASQARRA